MKKKILIADDHFVVRAGTTIILESEYDNLEILYAEKYSEVLQLVKDDDVDLIILDINMPESKHKLMVKEIKMINPQSKILIFSAYEENVAIQYIMEGADGYVNKLSSETEILNAVKSIFENGNYYPNDVIQKIIHYTNDPKKFNLIENLSEREKEIFDLLLMGNGNLEISNVLNIHMSTISTYKKRIYKKLNVKSLAELIHLNNSQAIY